MRLKVLLLLSVSKQAKRRQFVVFHVFSYFETAVVRVDKVTSYMMSVLETVGPPMSGV